MSQVALLRALHRCAGRHRTRNTTEEMVARKEGGADYDHESVLERYRARNRQLIVRDSSTTLGMTRGRFTNKESAYRLVMPGAAETSLAILRERPRGIIFRSAGDCI